jgi:dimethylargininase
MDGPVAVTRDVSDAMAACELTHLARVPIDIARARAQHQSYVGALTQAGYRVEQLASSAAMPDAVFVEDAAVVLDELAIVTRPGAPSRRAEVTAVAEALSRYRRLESIEAPGTIDGGDVLVVGRRVFIGESTRTTADAIAQVRRILGPHGYTVCAVAVHACLHLKSAATCIDHDAVLLNPEWIAADTFRGCDIVRVHPDEAHAANVLRLRDRVIVAAAFPRTAERLSDRGLAVVAVEASELAKAEGAVTCCSLVIEDRQD